MDRKVKKEGNKSASARKERLNRESGSDLEVSMRSC